jgi:hypothetical protein
MEFRWDDSRRAFTDAAEWFVRKRRWWPAAGRTPVWANGMSAPLVGHTSRSFLTVETYLARPAAAVEIPSAAACFRATRAAAAVAEIAARVLPLLDRRDGTELLTTIAGGMRLSDYLPTRTFELAVHTADLAATLGEPLDVPPTAAAQALGIVADLAIADNASGPRLLAATGRPRFPAGFSVL